MDGMLEDIFGAGDDDAQRQGKARDFVQRYDDGLPHENISDDEARNYFRAVAQRLSPRDLEESAAESYERLTADERQMFAEALQRNGGNQSAAGGPDDTRQMARMTSQLHAENPSGLVNLIGGDGTGDPLTGGDDGAVGSQVRGQGGGVGELLQNPVARAALGGIAAAAMRKMLR